MAVIAISWGSSSGSSHRRRITMLVSRSPCWYSTGIGVVRLLLCGGVLVGAEGVQGDVRGGAGHGGELAAGDEAAAFAQGNELANAMAVAGDGEGLPPLDGVHDLFGPGAQVTLSDLRLCSHGIQDSGG